MLSIAVLFIVGFVDDGSREVEPASLAWRMQLTGKHNARLTGGRRLKAVALFRYSMAPTQISVHREYTRYAVLKKERGYG